MDSNIFYLPALRAFLGKLRKVHRSFWVFLLMLLSACLHKVGIWGHFASRLLWILTHLVLLKHEKDKCVISGECFPFTLLITLISAIRVLLCQLHLLFKIGWWEGGLVIDNSLYVQSNMMLLSNSIQQITYLLKLHLHLLTLEQQRCRN